MKDLPIFIASSVWEFKQARLELSPFLEMLNRVYRRMEVQLVWNRPEISSRTLADGGSQSVYDEYIRKSEFFVLIVERGVGPYTRREYEVALKQFCKIDPKTGLKTGLPKILPCFLANTSPEAQKFREELCAAPIGEQFIDLYDNFDAVKNQLQWELANYIVKNADETDVEADMNRARERVVGKIHSLQEELQRLEEEPASQETLAQITLNYTELARLVRAYKVEPDALLDYMSFLYKQHRYQEGIETGHWLEGFYTMEDPGDDVWSDLKNNLGLCYDDTNRQEEAERYYREALEIVRRLAVTNPAAFLPYVATTCNNLGVLLSMTNRMEEAETDFQESLEIRRQFAKTNPAIYLPDVATTCTNLGNLLYSMNRMEEAERYYREALEIVRRLSETDSAAFLHDVATTCNNLGALLDDANRMEEAERYYQEALEIHRQLVETNPDAFLPYVAATCYNLGLFERNRNHRKAARQYFEEALSLYEQFPHLAKEAQDCRDALAEL